MKRYKPTSSGLRHKQLLDFSETITKKQPEKRLVKTLKQHSGRNNQGKITVRHQFRGAKKQYRVVDFLRQKKDVPAIVKAIEYDPYRTANVALIFYKDGEKSYILAPQGLEVGAEIL